MKQADMLPAFLRKAFYCPVCGVLAPQEWFALRREEPEDSSWDQLNASEIPEMTTYDWRDGAGGRRDQIVQRVKAQGSWHQSQCSNCSKYLTWRSETIVYPIGAGLPAPHEDMPSGVEALYNEARAVALGSPRAAAALARTALEAFLHDCGPQVKGKTLNDRVLALQPLVSSGLYEMINTIRLSGNKALHVADSTSAAVVLVLESENLGALGLLLESMNELVDELITKPKRRRELLDRFAGNHTG